MDERVRRRKSSWEADGNLRNSWDQAYAGERMYKGGMDEPEMREQGSNKNYYRNMSPACDGWDRRKRSDSRDDGLSHSHRSRSRSRDRGRSRSRSQSWDRGRERDRDRDRDGVRSRSRSRSRNRNRNRTRAETRSRSPFHDRRRESHWSNDKIGSGLSSQICRDFAAGGCRRGSQCRFLHTNVVDGDSEDDLSDRWRSRPERGRSLRYGEEPGLQSWEKLSDSSYGDDSSRNKSKSTITCKNFIRGRCQWGASCRFSHHVGSSENVAKGVGNASFGQDRQHQGSERGKPLCKFFLVGKCNRENCWFSHDDSSAGNHERRPYEDGRHSLSVKSGGRNGPTWDQTHTESDIAKDSGWCEDVDVNQSTNAVSSERMDNKWGPEGRTWGSPERKENASEKSSFITSHEWNEDNGGIKPIVTGTSNDVKEHPQRSGLESKNLDEISTSSHARILTEENSNKHLPQAAANADVSIKSYSQQNEMALKDNLTKAFSYEGHGEVKELRSSMNQEFLPRKSPSRNGVGNLDFNRSLISNDPRENLFFSRPSTQSFDLNGPGQVLSSSLNMQNHHENQQKETAKGQVMQEFGAHKSFFSNISNGHVAQYFSTPASASSTQKFMDEQAHAHMHASLNPLTSTRTVATLQPTMLTESNPLGERGQNSDQTSVFPFEPKNQIPFEEFSPMSGDGIEPEETLPSGSSMAQFLESPKSKQQEEVPGISELKQHKMPAGLETKEEVTRAVSEQREQKTPAVSEVTHKIINSSAEQGKENVPKENGEGRGKVENVGGNKDDKDMRLFKNALVESVKEILKPTWKLGQMSRDVHKTIVKKVVDKVTSTIQADHIPKTKDKVDQYLSHAKTKLSKLVQAYVERHLKTDS